MTSISRKEAKELGLPFYHGSPCKKCGGAERYRISANCRACNLSDDRKHWNRLHYISRQEAVKCRRLERAYGITLAVFEDLKSRQQGLCAICGTEGELCVDHNHDTGEVRGLLCHLCNQGIGCLQDSPDVISQALKYLNDNGHYGPKEAGDAA